MMYNYTFDLTTVWYRGKSLDTGEWVYGIPFPRLIKEFDTGIEYVYFFKVVNEPDALLFVTRALQNLVEGKWSHLSDYIHRVDPNTIGRRIKWVDNKDNVTYLYEGDILNLGKDNTGKDIIGVVVYVEKEQAHRIALTRFVMIDPDNVPLNNVIGNVIDNPELLQDDHKN